MKDKVMSELVQIKAPDLVLIRPNGRQICLYFRCCKCDREFTHDAEFINSGHLASHLRQMICKCGNHQFAVMSGANYGWRDEEIMNIK